VLGVDAPAHILYSGHHPQNSDRSHVHGLTVFVMATKGTLVRATRERLVATIQIDRLLTRSVLTGPLIGLLLTTLILSLVLILILHGSKECGIEKTASLST
jgi:hypothetical protein